MGLDQYFYVKNKEKDDEEIGYFRKFYELNDWVCWNLCEKYDVPLDWNCEKIPIEEEDVDKLFWDIFFVFLSGNKNGEPCSDHIDGLLSMVKDIKLRINKGQEVYYYAWW